MNTYIFCETCNKLIDEWVYHHKLDVYTCFDCDEKYSEEEIRKIVYDKGKFIFPFKRKMFQKKAQQHQKINKNI